MEINMKLFNVTTHALKARLDSFELKEGIWLTFWLCLGIYIVYGTGIFSDDFALSQTEDRSYALIGPIIFLIREGFYGFVANEQYVYIELIKTLSATLAFFMAYRFFSIFQVRAAAIIAAFLFVFIPNHDATTFWYTGQSYLQMGALYFFAYVLLNQEKEKLAVLFSTLASFIWYGSTPYALGLAYLAYRKLGKRAAMLLLVPNLIYIIYYVVLTKVVGLGISRIPEHTGVLVLFKQFVLQVGTGIDALVGPSMWLKMALSVMEMSWASAFITAVALLLLVLPIRIGGLATPVVDRDVTKALVVTMVASWVMFAVTGTYPQIAFNLGDRVTLWGSILIGYLIACFAVKNKIVYTLTVALLLCAVIGDSNHWKQWNDRQLEIISDIRSNTVFSELGVSDTVYVVGNHYSKLGPISNIEFVSEPYSAEVVFRHALHDGYKFKVLPLGARDQYEQGMLVDVKTGAQYPVDEAILVYDTDSDTLVTVESVDLQNYLATLPKERRHWIQFFDQSVLLDWATKLMPRLRYAL